MSTNRDLRRTGPTAPVKVRWPVGVSALVLALATSGGGVQAQDAAGSHWRLVFAVDSTGAATHGDKEALLESVRAGLPVRVGWRVTWRLQDGRTGGVEHVADAGFLTIYQGEVFAQLAPIVRQRPSLDAPDITLIPSETWVGVLDSTGRLRGTFRESGETRVTRVAVRWSVAEPAGGSAGPAASPSWWP